MKKVLVLALALALILGMVSLTPAVAEAKSVKIGVSVADLANVFYADITDGMKAALKDGDELIIMDANFDTAKQIADIEDMIQQGVSVMLVDPVDSESIRSSLEACQAANIPVIAFNSPCKDADLVACTVASDNYLAGQLIGKALGEAMGGKGEVAMLTYDVAVVCFDRSEGFVNALSEFPEIKVVVRQEIQPGTDTALPVMENMLQGYPDITGVFCLNDPSGIGAAAAIQAANLQDKIKVVAVDGSADGKAAIADGRLLASAAQQPIEIGKLSVENAYKLIAGETVEKDVKVPTTLVDITNCK